MTLSSSPRGSEIIDETLSVPEAIALLNMTDQEAEGKMPELATHQGNVKLDTGRSGTRENIVVSPADNKPGETSWCYRVYMDNGEVIKQD